MKPGDHFVYPKMGVCQLKRIDDREVGGRRKKFLVLQALETQMTIMCPVDQMHAINLRPLVDETTVHEALSVIREKDGIEVDQTTWNMRYRDYQDRLQSGSPKKIATVLRNLMILRREKDLSFGERKMIDQAVTLLALETAIVLNVSKQDAEALIQEAMAA